MTKNKVFIISKVSVNENSVFLTLKTKMVIPKFGYLKIILGFECCVQYQHNECNCSYSCKFVKEYFEDSKELTNEEMKQLSSEWSERRRLSLVEKEKRKEEEAEAQKEIWRRVQEMMNDD